MRPNEHGLVLVVADDTNSLVPLYLLNIQLKLGPECSRCCEYILRIRPDCSELSRPALTEMGMVVRIEKQVVHAIRSGFDSE